VPRLLGHCGVGCDLEHAQVPSLCFHEDKGLSYAVFFVLGLWIGCALGIVLMILAQKWRREG
jgi:hypothetical protein